MIRLRFTSRCCAVGLRTQLSNCSRCAAETDTAFVMQAVYEFFSVNFDLHERDQS